MAINSNRGSITTTRGTILAYPFSSGPHDPAHQPPSKDVWVRSTSGTAYLGGTGVTGLTGFPVTPNVTLGPINVDAGETLCAIRNTTGTTTIRYLISSYD